MIQNDSRPFNFLGLESQYSSFEKSKIVILPVAYQSSNLSHEIILASRNVELKDEDFGKEIYKIGIHTLDEIRDVSMEELYTVSRQIIQAGKFQATLGGEAGITSSLVKAQLEKWPSMKILHINVQALQQVDHDSEWFVKAVDELPEHVYLSMNFDGMELNELTRRELMNLTRELTHRRNVVGLDLAGLSLQPEQALFCAKLIYKILGLIFNR